MFEDPLWMKTSFVKRNLLNRWNIYWSHFIHSHERSSRLWSILVLVTVLTFLIRRRLVNYESPSIDFHLDRLSLRSSSKAINRTSHLLLDYDNPSLNHAIIVCAHAVWSGKRDFWEYLNPDAWVLDDGWSLDENTSINSIRAYMETLKTGLDLMMHEDHIRSSLLIISGGQTRASAGPISEAWSYYQLARYHDWIGNVQRVILEEYARDSFENLLFSLCRFYEVTGHYPTRVTIISLDIKRARFEDIYRVAIGFPKDSFKFLGIPLYSSLSSSTLPSSSISNVSYPNQSTISFDILNSFLKDPYGCHTPSLIEKRHYRNPFRRRPAYDSTCPHLASLLHYCGPSLYYPSTRLPWS